MKKLLFRAAIVVLLCVFAYSAISLGTYIYNSIRAQSLHSDLQSMVQANRPTRPPVTPTQDSQSDTQPTGDTEPTEPPFVTVVDPDTGKEVQILPEYAELYRMNNDLVGWIQVPGTSINYPVMQTPDRPNYYLKKDFNEKFDEHGSIYADEEANVFSPSDNITIYGHQMHDNTMFAPLNSYMKKSFFDENRYIYFDTLAERHTYEIVVVFRTVAILGQGFSYHAFIDAADKAAFHKYIDTCKSLALYDTGVDVQYGDKLITLSTCDFTQAEGRLVVVAKRVQ